MRNLLLRIRHFFCRNVIWLYPTLALFDAKNRRGYVLRCKECGFKTSRSAGEIQEAALREGQTT